MPGLHSPFAQPILRPDLGPLAGALREPLIALAEVVDRCIERAIAWQRRAVDRALLAEMSERDLRDVGLNRSDVLVESDKPFWRA